MGGWPCAGEEWGEVAELLGLVDNFALVRGIAAAVLRSCVAWRSGIVAAVPLPWPMRITWAAHHLRSILCT